MRRSGAYLSLCVTSCAGVQNAFGGQGAEDANFVRLFAVFMVVCTVMYLIVSAALVIAVWRRRQATRTIEDRKHHETSAATRPALIVWTVLIAVGLVGLTIASFFTDRSNAANGSKPRLSLTVTANQWWWDVEYNSPDASKIVRTANEIHLPVGVPAQVTLKSNDVIHSFWIPNLAGKQDLIPGRVTDAQLLPRKTGLFRGQCAEFCGKQHAHMAFTVVAQSEAEFERWLNGQRALAQRPTTDRQQRGQEVFLAKPCSVCHTVLGTPAHGHVGPDLTHIASRTSIAARTLTTSHQNLASWIQNSQAVKPGNHMPPHELSADDVDAVVAYLQSLQ